MDKQGSKRGKEANLRVVHELSRLDEEPGDGQEGEGSWRYVVHGGDGVEREAPSLETTSKIDTCLFCDPIGCALHRAAGMPDEHVGSLVCHPYAAFVPADCFTSLGWANACLFTCMETGHI